MGSATRCWWLVGGGACCWGMVARLGGGWGTCWLPGFTRPGEAGWTLGGWALCRTGVSPP